MVVLEDTSSVPAGRISERCGSDAERRPGVLIPPCEEVANGNGTNVDNNNKLNRWVDHARVSSSTALAIGVEPRSSHLNGIARVGPISVSCADNGTELRMTKAGASFDLECPKRRLN